MNLNEKIDVTDVVPIGIDFEVNGKTYTLIYNYRAILRLSQQYGDMTKAMESFADGDIYENTINFLYCGLCDAYGLKKQEIEGWIGMDIAPWRDIVYKAIVAAYGSRMYHVDEENEVETEGESAGNI